LHLEAKGFLKEVPFLVGLPPVFYSDEEGAKVMTTYGKGILRHIEEYLFLGLLEFFL
jgi:hypothetical protein